MSDRERLAEALEGFEMLCDHMDAWLVGEMDGKDVFEVLTEVAPNHLHVLADAARTHLESCLTPDYEEIRWCVAHRCSVDSHPGDRCVWSEDMEGNLSSCEIVSGRLALGIREETDE